MFPPQGHSSILLLWRNAYAASTAAFFYRETHRGGGAPLCGLTWLYARNIMKDFAKFNPAQGLTLAEGMDFHR
jgi:hypothetical protein